MSEAVVDPKTDAGPVDVTKTPEFELAVKQAREEERAALDAEYRRKQKELEESYRQPPTNGGTPADYFAGWSERHGIPAEAGRELATAIVAHVEGVSLRPLTQAWKTQELRSQRQELRESNPKLARLDAKYHDEVMKMLAPLAPNQIGADSYMRALQMVIGAHIETLDEAPKADAGDRQVVPGPEPLASSGHSKPSKIVLNSKQKEFCENKGFAEEDFVEMMRDRARKMESQGKAKPAIRAVLGDLLGSIEF